MAKSLYVKNPEVDEDELYQKAIDRQVKAKDYISNYGADYGISSDDIGWYRNDPNSAGTVTLGGYDLANLSSIDDKNSGWASESNLKQAIDNYAAQRGLTKQSEAAQTLSSQYSPSNYGYTDTYSQKIDEILNGLMNAKPFNYNPEKDASYQAYEEQYSNLGDRALSNTLSEASALTGGRTNSWAVSAANQAKANYDQHLSAIIPQLEANAYDRYVEELGQNRQNVYDLMNLDEAAYDRALNDRNFSYGVNRDLISDQNYADEVAYNKAIDEWNQNYRMSRDEVSDQQYTDQMLYNQQQADRGNALSWANYNLNQDKYNYSQRQDALDRQFAREQFDYQKDQDTLSRLASQNNVDANDLGVLYSDMMSGTIVNPVTGDVEKENATPAEWLNYMSRFIKDDNYIKSLEGMLPSNQGNIFILGGTK